MLTSWIRRNADQCVVQRELGLNYTEFVWQGVALLDTILRLLIA